MLYEDWLDKQQGTWNHDKPSNRKYTFFDWKGNKVEVEIPAHLQSYADAASWSDKGKYWKEWTKYYEGLYNYDHYGIAGSSGFDGRLKDSIPNLAPPNPTGYSVADDGHVLLNDAVKDASVLAPYNSPSSSSGSGGGGGAGVTIVPPGNSGESVDEDTLDWSIFGDYEDYFKLLKEYSDYNTAQSVDLADRQNAWQAEQNRIAMDVNIAEAERNRAWQMYMSNSSHQREVQDLMAAGLNPVLSASGGNGAAVTSGATAQGVTSAGAKGEQDKTFVTSILQYVNNLMGYAAQTASAGISAGAVLGAARINYDSARDNTQTQYGLIRRFLDEVLFNKS